MQSWCMNSPEDKDLMTAIWPLYGLRVSTPRLVLRYPSELEIMQLAQRVATEGVHGPDEAPFNSPWNIGPQEQVQRNFYKFHIGLRASWEATRFRCNLVVEHEGDLIGIQHFGADNFALSRVVSTGSFLVLNEHGRGLGTEMRAAVLHLAFEGLGATHAYTSAWSDNLSSQGVTRKNGYEANGSEQIVYVDRVREQRKFALTRERWLANRRADIFIEGLDSCRQLFGLEPTDR